MHRSRLHLVRLTAEPGYGEPITEHVQVRERTDVGDEPGHEIAGLDDRLRARRYDVRAELEIEMMLLQLKVMHHLLEAMRRTMRRPASTGRPLADRR